MRAFHMMVLLAALLVMALLHPTAEAVVATYRCPDAGDDITIDIAHQHIQLPNFDGGLCLLTIHDHNAMRIPVARSYDGYDWEISAGRFADTLTVHCRFDDSSTCEMILPALTSIGQTYVLSSYESYLATNSESSVVRNQRATVARFLEQASFGVQRADLDGWDWNGHGADDRSNGIIPFRRWIVRQMDESITPTSSHRGFFRQRTNPRLTQSFIGGLPGPKPCDVGARFRRYVCVSEDRGKELTVSSSSAGGTSLFAVSVDGIVRTFMQTQILLVKFDDWDASIDPSSAVPIQLDTAYVICGDDATFYQNGVGSPLRVKPFVADADNGDGDQDACLQFLRGNPAVYFPPSHLDGIAVLDFGTYDSIEGSSQQHLKRLDEVSYDSEYWKHSNDGDDYIVLNELERQLCDAYDHAFIQMSEPIIARFQDANDAADPFKFLLYDPRLVLRENTVQNPLEDGGGAMAAASGDAMQCANVPRSFLNEDHCFLSTAATACSSAAPPVFSVQLTPEFLAAAHAITGRLYYSIAGLPLSDETYRDRSNNLQYFQPSPCGLHKNRWSRWMQVDQTNCQNNDRVVTEETEHVFAILLQPSFDDIPSSLPAIKDVQLYQTQECSKADRDIIDLGFVTGLDGTCWQHVHSLHSNVYDFSQWTIDHPGGAQQIEQPSRDGSTELVLPASHQADGNHRFYANIHSRAAEYPLLGKLGDYVPYSDLPQQLQVREIQRQFGVLPTNEARGAVVVCGSDGEVANDPFLGTGFEMEYFDDERFRDHATPSSFTKRQKNTIWSHIALFGKDQLRQRVAFALSQILVVTPALLNDEHGTETTIAFYDIFVRNAFGNYRDILKQVSFHDKMGEMLSSLNSKSMQYSIDYGEKAYPDENFAREIMQLFSIGLVRLNLDGTAMMDVHGNAIATYDNSDVRSFARAWTGFQRQQDRGNYENRFSRVDPMQISGRRRDPFPKSDLHGGYIGDRYPLCADMPDKHFVKKGATYRLLGSRSLPELQEDKADWEKDPEVLRLVLQIASPLREALCSSAANDGECSFPGKVVLDASLDYSNLHTGDHPEMMVDTIRTVQVQSSPVPIYYEYVQPACVHQAFFPNARRVMDYANDDGVIRSNMCADPRTAVAVESCCDDLWWNDGGFPWGYKNCAYQGERLSYDSAESRCHSIGKIACDYAQMRPWKVGICAKDVWSTIERLPIYYHWTTASCSIQVKVNSYGEIAIVHNPPDDFAGRREVPSSVSNRSENYFKTSWTNGRHPNPSNGCAADGAACMAFDNACICDTALMEEPVFHSASSPSATYNSILSRLHIGAFDPFLAASSGEAYTDRGDCNGSIPNAKVLTKDGDCNSLDKNTVFMVKDENGVTRYLKNMHSTVRITGSNGGTAEYSFRNPVHFISLVDPEVRDAYYETDAVLDEYFFHPNHPPFLASRMIQRFGISNPSPRYIHAVAQAYTSGSYNGIGTGTYGNVGALVAAILLDREARCTVLDSDPGHGQLREPILKLIAFLRSMEYHHDSPMLWPLLSDLTESIGQCAYEAQSIFSFFLPEFAPAGSMSQSSLHSPEAQVLSPYTAIGFLDGVFTTVKHGIVPMDCRRGLGKFKPRGLRQCVLSTSFDDTSRSFGVLQYRADPLSSEHLVDELALLLTSSRLRQINRDMILQAIEPFMSTDTPKATRLAQQLMAATPEFHATNLVRSNGESEALPDPGSALARNHPYKAVVYLMLEGGMDSFNLLVPKEDCNSKDLYDEYKTVRGKVALKKSELLSIDAAGSNQPCDTFGVNEAIPILRDLYDDKDATFFANTGVLGKPVSKLDWDVGTKSQLFSHNSQQDEVYSIDVTNEFMNTGVGGRILDVLRQRGFVASAASVGTSTTMLSAPYHPDNVVREIPQDEPIELNGRPEVEGMNSLLLEMNTLSQPDSSVFGDLWSSAVSDAVSNNDEELHIYKTFTVGKFPSGGLGENFRSVAQWIKSRDHRAVEREVIFVRHSGYDHHAVTSSSNLKKQLKEVNKALSAFVAEMKEQDIWDSIAVVSGSEFGRTLSPNSGDGTDHGWGGHGFLLGGGLKGGTILGEYPSDLTQAGPSIIDRGRVIPSLPLEAEWQAIAQWMGVTHQSDLDTVLPNRDSFDHCSLFSDMDLFLDGKVHHSACSGINDDMSMDTHNTTCRDRTIAMHPATIEEIKVDVSEASSNGSDTDNANIAVYSDGRGPQCECPSSSAASASNAGFYWRFVQLAMHAFLSSLLCAAIVSPLTG